MNKAWLNWIERKDYPSYLITYLILKVVWEEEFCCNQVCTILCSAGVCGSGWTAFADRCVKFVARSKSFSQAESACHNRGGTLLRLNHLQEGLELPSLVGLSACELFFVFVCLFVLPFCSFIFKLLFYCTFIDTVPFTKLRNIPKLSTIDNVTVCMVAGLDIGAVLRTLLLNGVMWMQKLQSLLRRTQSCQRFFKA